MALDLVQTILGHHAPVLEIVVAGPGLLVPVKRKTELAGCGLDHTDALRHHLLANPITGNHRDLMLCHVRFSLSSDRTSRPPLLHCGEIARMWPLVYVLDAPERI